MLYYALQYKIPFAFFTNYLLLEICAYDIIMISGKILSWHSIYKTTVKTKTSTPLKVTTCHRYVASGLKHVTTQRVYITGYGLW